jgi:hypothetical protein
MGLELIEREGYIQYIFSQFSSYLIELCTFYANLDLRKIRNIQVAVKLLIEHEPIAITPPIFVVKRGLVQCLASFGMVSGFRQMMLDLACATLGSSVSSAIGLRKMRLLGVWCSPIGCGDCWASTMGWFRRCICEQELLTALCAMCLERSCLKAAGLVVSGFGDRDGTEMPMIL